MPDPSRLRRLVAALGLLLAAILLLRTVVDVVAATSSEWLWDDAYMYVRYADHFLSGFGVRWNPREPPTYGLTSLLFLAPVTILRAFTPASDGAAVLAASLGSGVILLALLGVLAWRLAVDAPGRGVALLPVAFAVLWRPGLERHFSTGMDTTFAMAALTGFLLAAIQLFRAPTRRGAVWIGLAGGALYVARPDLMLFPAGVLAAAVLGARDRASRGHALAAAAACAAVLVAELIAARVYFGTAVPLPFYAKGTALYGSAMRASYATTAGEQLAEFVRLHWPLLALAASPLAGGLRRLRATWRPLELGVLAATLAYGAYFRFLVLQVMPYSQRFYQPTLPPLVFLAARAAVEWLRAPPSLFTTRRAAWLAGVATPLLLLALFDAAEYGWASVEQLGVRVAAARSGANGPSSDGGAAEEAATDANEATWRSAIFLARELPDLPDDLVLAGTDIGYIAARARRKRVVDLAALHDTDFALHGFSADRLLRVDRPDLLFLPHKDYAEMRAAIRGHPVFLAEYDLFTKQRVRGLGFALRRTSPHYPELVKLAEPWLLDPPKPSGH